jgi:MOSC domain-containing protein YiiM
MDPNAHSLGTMLHLGNAVVEITQIGKEDKHDYTIEEHSREWVNIRKGAFAKVVKGGDIDTGSSCHYNE